MPSASAATANGTLTRKTDDQSNHWSSSPPVSGPSPIPTAASAAQMPIALPRSSPTKRLAMIERVAGMIIAAPTPIAARTAITSPAESATSAPRLASPKIDTPAWSASLRPRRSPSVPKTSSRPANTSRYDSTIHCSFELEASNSSWRVGRATLRIVLSSPMITRLRESTARVFQRRVWLITLEERRAARTGDLTGFERQAALRSPQMLYGRDPERSRIGELLEGARASRSAVLVISGEPGVGKSALLEDARGQAGDMLVLSGVGVESEAQLPFAA